VRAGVDNLHRGITALTHEVVDELEFAQGLDPFGQDHGLDAEGRAVTRGLCVLWIDAIVRVLCAFDPDPFSAVAHRHALHRRGDPDPQRREVVVFGDGGRRRQCQK
ncbi:hypothetical protein RZS08_41175, partial [Arthrospira platensis SPKY1]|nr:hypothetical protein [Arthrospira platensis SPKY1]